MDNQSIESHHPEGSQMYSIILFRVNHKNPMMGINLQLVFSPAAFSCLIRVLHVVLAQSRKTLTFEAQPPEWECLAGTQHQAIDASESREMGNDESAKGLNGTECQT